LRLHSSMARYRIGENSPKLYDGGNGERTRKVCLDLDDLVIVTIGVDGGINVLEKSGAVARDKAYATDLALLQVFVWIECITQTVGMACDDFIALHLGARSARLKLRELIFHFFFCIRSRVHEGGIEPRQRSTDSAQ